MQVSAELPSLWEAKQEVDLWSLVGLDESSVTRPDLTVPAAQAQAAIVTGTQFEVQLEVPRVRA